jgi:acyl-CoA thioester hydrolase
MVLKAAYLGMMRATRRLRCRRLGQERYRQIERTWLIAAALELLLPVVYGDGLLVTTWVADFHRVRSIRAYEFHHEESGDLLARAYTDWVFIDTSSGRPVSIPPEITAAYHAQPDERLAALRAPFACPTPPVKGAYSHIRAVSWNESILPARQ